MKHIFIVLYIFMIIGCTGKKEEVNSQSLSKDDFISYLRNKNVDPAKYKRIVVIPGAGCGGCISDAQTFYTKNFQNQTILFIFTGISDLKVLDNAMPANALKGNNTLVDTANYLIDHGFKSIYPSEASFSSDDEKVKLNVFSQ